jgi:hypothetical protein
MGGVLDNPYRLLPDEQLDAVVAVLENEVMAIEDGFLVMWSDECAKAIEQAYEDATNEQKRRRSALQAEK